MYLPLWLVLLIGSTLGLIGYGVQYLFLTNRITGLCYGHIWFLTVLAGNSICWINTVSYLVSIRNFPSERQVAVGITTSYVGLSAKVYTDIVDLMFPRKRAEGYLLVSSTLPLVVCCVAAPVVRYVDVVGGTPAGKKMIIAMFGLTIGVGMYGVLGSLGPLSSWLSPLARVSGMGLLILVAPVVIVVGGKVLSNLAYLIKCREERVYVEAAEAAAAAEKMENENEQGEDIGVKVLVRRVEFWLYFFVYMFGVTLGLVFSNNLGQIAESRGCGESSSALVSVSSSFGFLGRLLPSLTDYYLQRSSSSSRAGCVVALMAPTAGAFFLLVNPTKVCLYISTALIGVCTGAITSISVSLTADLFGTKNFGVNHNIVVANIPIGSFVFGYLAALVYSRGGGGVCVGVLCYQTSFILWGSLCLFGTVLALILYIRTKNLYYNNSNNTAAAA